MARLALETRPDKEEISFQLQMGADSEYLTLHWVT